MEIETIQFPASVREELAEQLRNYAITRYPYSQGRDAYYRAASAASIIEIAIEKAINQFDHDAIKFKEFIHRMRSCTSKSRIPSFVIIGAPVDRPESIIADAWRDGSFDYERKGSRSVGKTEFVTELFHQGLIELLNLSNPTKEIFDQGGYHNHTLILPREQQLGARASIGASEFNYHTDGAYLKGFAKKYSNYIILGAVRNSGTYTTVATLGQVIKNFSEIFTPEEFELLTRPFFEFRSGPSAVSDVRETTIAPVIKVNPNGQIREIRIYQDPDRLQINACPRLLKDMSRLRDKLEVVRHKLINHALGGIGVNLLIEPNSTNHVFINNNLELHRRDELSDADNPLKNERRDFRLLVRTSACQRY